jgi:hypothetical protein
MNLKILKFNNNDQDYTLIGKTGQFRFKIEFANRFKFEKKDIWVMAVDTEEINKNKQVLLLKNPNAMERLGKKMIKINNSWSIDATPIIKEFKLSIPVKCRIESYKAEGYEGFKIEIP